MSKKEPTTRRFNKHTTALQVLEGVDLTGKTILVTGANSGIGYEAARALALHNAHVVMACRNLKTAEKAQATIRNEKPDARLDLIKLDLGELASVEACANEYLSRGWPLHVLILNAGIYNPEHRVTDDGFEATFQINHLAGFHLTHILLEKLTPSRIVVVASAAHKIAGINAQNISWERLSPTEKNKLNSAFKAYAISKFCNILFASELQRRLKGKNVIVTSLHPGVIHTNITRNSGAMDCFFQTLMKPGTISEEQGASTTVYCATAPEVEEHGGEYFEECKATLPDSKARDAVTSAKLWQISEQMLDHYKMSLAKQRAQEADAAH